MNFSQGSSLLFRRQALCCSMILGIFATLSAHSVSAEELKVVSLQASEIKIVQELTDLILLRYFFGTRGAGGLTIWSSPRRDDVIEAGAPYLKSETTWHMYPEPDALLDSQGAVKWKDPSKPQLTHLGAPLVTTEYCFSLMKPVSVSRQSIIDGIIDEASRTSAVYPEVTYKLERLVVVINDCRESPPGWELKQVTVLPLTVAVN